MDNNLNNFIKWLQEQHDQIMGVEAEGITLLNQGNADEYRKKMRQKAEMLGKLSGSAQAVIAGVNPELANNIIARLERFSKSAETSLAINSVFYMSALLYPDEHKKGEPDNLQLYINELKS